MKIWETVKIALADQGKTQKWLCDETGIPASHLSEFINGTRSFKLEKLEKIAMALGKNWNLVDNHAKKRRPQEISLIEIKGERGTLKLRRTLFWDTDNRKINFAKNSKLIIERVFTRGTVDEFKQVMQYYGTAEIKRTIVKIGFLDNKTLNFASQIFKIDKTKFLCYKKKQSTAIHWH
jgi:transcriptional regulator with XRE-family HTH domain